MWKIRYTFSNNIKRYLHQVKYLIIEYCKRYNYKLTFINFTYNLGRISKFCTITCLHYAIKPLCLNKILDSMLCRIVHIFKNMCNLIIIFTEHRFYSVIIYRLIFRCAQSLTLPDSRNIVLSTSKYSPGPKNNPLVVRSS